MSWDQGVKMVVLALPPPMRVTIILDHESLRKLYSPLLRIIKTHLYSSNRPTGP